MGGMKPYYEAPGVTMYLGDCIEVMRQMPEASVDAVVCDPPYGLEFMGKEWDAPWKADGFRRALNEADVGRDDPFGRTSRTSPEDRAGREFQAWCETWAREALRVLKPGGYLLAFGGTRTYHRLASGVEDAGFEVRDTLAWIYGSGFPKSLDVSKAIDKAAGAEREVIGRRTDGRYAYEFSEAAKTALGATVTSEDASGFSGEMGVVTAPATEDARRWQGWGTALKPAYEPIVMARKPLQGTVAANVLRHGTGALNIDGTRIAGEPWTAVAPNAGGRRSGIMGQPAQHLGGDPHPSGRWPANVLLDEEAAALLDAQAGERPSSHNQKPAKSANSWFGESGYSGSGYNDIGGASRFFYTAKASRSEREAGLDDLPPALRTDGRNAEHHTAHLRTNERHNDHPTVKPVALMRWLVTLVTPPGGVVLDPFLGSGTTVMAALDIPGIRAIGIDMAERYVEIAKYRVTHRHLIEPGFREPAAGIPQGRLI